ncbi:MAG TPA: sulfatase-like hydrolase/transferase [Tepidisphaeraceae bacterium]|nr:sulfatase-like hydrolase/transferase [Tepidisphaeraceae bacterium]
MFHAVTTTRILCTFAVVLGSIIQTARCQTTPRPNILLILTDDQGFGDLSSYGAKDLRTPNMDSIVARGMRFDNFYANCPVCSPSRAAILSGKYPDRVGVPGLVRTDPKDNWAWLSPDAALLPAVLHKAGYHTALVGKWNLGLDAPNSPNAKGFDLFHGFLGDMMEDYYTHLRQGHNYMRLNDQEIDPQGHATDIFTQWAIEYIRGRSGAAKEGHPFFLYLAYNAPHVPIQPPEMWLKRVKDRQPGISEKRAKMVALLEQLDGGIGQVLAALKNAGLEQNTLVFFTSDNGGQVDVGASVGPYRGTKGTMYEGGLRIPMATMWPGHIEPGSRSLAVAAHMDIMASICQATGATPPADIDGISLLPVLTGKAQKVAPQRELYFVRREGGMQYLGLTSHALRHGDWKLVQTTPFSPLELFNLNDDPREEHDLARSRPRIRNELARILQQHIQQAGAVRWEKPSESSR